MTALLLAALAAAPCELPAAATLTGARETAACELMSRHGAAPALSTPLASIYERPGFENARRRNTGALRAYLARLRALLEGFFESSGAEAYSNVTRFVVLLAGALLAVFVTLRLLARRRARLETVAEAAPSASLQLEEPSTHLSRARDLLGAAPREAIREALLSLLSHLERQRLARPDRVKTNRELAAELPERGAPSELTATVTTLLRWYDGAFYSLDPVEAAAAKRFIDDVAAAGARVAGAGSGGR